MRDARLISPLAAAPALFGGLLLLIGMVVPVPYGPRWDDGHAHALRLPLCVQLTDGKGLYDTYVPPAARLSGTAVPGLRGWYVAAFREAHGVPESGWWRAYAADSVEIRWYHSASIRLKIAQATITGSVQPAGTIPAIYWSWIRPRPVFGTIQSCTGSPSGPPNESLQPTGGFRKRAARAMIRPARS